MAKIILISPPYVDLYGKLDKAAGRYFPLGLGYIAAYLRKYGNHDVEMYEMDAQGLSLHDIAGIIKKGSPDVIGLTCSTPSFFRAIELAKAARDNSPAKIVLGGVHASALPEFILNNYSGLIDCVICGEGEITMLELVNAYQNKSEIGVIKGVVYKKNSSIVSGGNRPFIQELDSIPFPARDLIPQRLFMPNLHNMRYKRCFSILTSRGCPFNCSFCASRIVSGERYRMHSAEYVLDEMDMLKTDYNAQQLLITDDTFTLNNDRLEKVCKGMIDRKLNLKWFCFSQVNTVNRAILKLMKKAGCYNIGFGIESGNEEGLRKIGKPINLQKGLETVHMANRLGFKTQAFYIFGLPGEKREEMLQTIKFAKKVGATVAFFNMLVPYPGTRDFRQLFSSIPLEKIDWRSFVAVGEHCVLKNSCVAPAEIEKMMAKAYFQYYVDPLRIASLLFHIRTFDEFFNYVKGGMSLLSQVVKWRNPTHKDSNKAGNPL